jgi:hypothetical protein
VTPDTVVQGCARGAGPQIERGGGVVCTVDRRGGPGHLKVAAAAVGQNCSARRVRDECYCACGKSGDALAPVAFELCTRTSIAAPAARPERLYGLMTPDTVVQVAAPEGLDSALNAVAALCVLSIAGAAQVTIRVLPVPCANDALGVLGMNAVVAVVSVLVMLEARGCTSSLRAGWLDRLRGMSTFLVRFLLEPRACGDAAVVVYRLVYLSYCMAEVDIWACVPVLSPQI